MATERGGLPHVRINMGSGMVNSVEVDGVRMRGVKNVSFSADVTGSYPVVTLELWAKVELSGEVALTIEQDRYVQRCTRPHASEDGPVPVRTQERAPEVIRAHYGGIVDAS